MSHTVRTGVAVAVTRSPAASAVADSGTHAPGSTQSQVAIPTRPTTSPGGAVEGTGAGWRDLGRGLFGQGLGGNAAGGRGWSVGREREQRTIGLPRAGVRRQAVGPVELTLDPGRAGNAEPVDLREGQPVG